MGARGSLAASAQPRPVTESGGRFSGEQATILVLLRPETLAGMARPVPVAFWALAAAVTPGKVPPWRPRGFGTDGVKWRPTGEVDERFKSHAWKACEG